MSDKVRDSIDQLHDSGIYLPTRTCFIFGEIDKETCEQHIKNLHILDNYSQGTVTIKLNCVGGDTQEGLAIYDAIRAMKNNIRIILYGEASSMGSIILQAGDERLIMPHGYVMIHVGEEGVYGHPQNNERWLKTFKAFESACNDILFEKIKTKKPRFTRKDLQKLILFDTILFADQALAYGLIDGIINEPY